jgi:hypothetical protein
MLLNQVYLTPIQGYFHSAKAAMMIMKYRPSSGLEVQGKGSKVDENKQNNLMGKGWK